MLGTNRNLFTLVQAEKWNGVLPTTMVPGSAVPFVSVNRVERETTVPRPDISGIAALHSMLWEGNRIRIRCRTKLPDGQIRPFLRLPELRRGV